MKALFLAAGLMATAGMAAAETPVLTVYTYDSFAADWGPGPALEKGFESVCGCDLRFVTAGDGAALLSRVAMEGAASPADVMLGIDTNLVARARATGLFAPHAPVAATSTLPVPYDDATFLPYDWGWFAFVYDKTKLANPPKSFAELAASPLKVVIEDPRSSTPGLGLLLWVKTAYGDGAAKIWADLADNIVTVTPSWDDAYALFLKGEADMVLSYTTSPAYHLIAENDPSKAAAPFAEGHYLQVEVAAKLAATKNGALADQFLAYLASPAAQDVLPTTNWMYPAFAGTLPQGFDTLIKPEKSLLLTADQAAAARDGALAEWQSALAR